MLAFVKLQFPTVLLLFSTCTRGAIINIKQSKCSPPQSPNGLKPVFISDLPLFQTFSAEQDRPYRSSALNRTLILDKFFPEEWTILTLYLRKITDRIAILTVSCPPVMTEYQCLHFMLVQTRTGRTTWIKHVVVHEQQFYGFHYGWQKAFLTQEPSNESFVLKVCHLQQIRMNVVTGVQINHTRMRCARVDIDGQRRSGGHCAPLQLFAQLARRVTNGRISYPDGAVRLFVLKLIITFGCAIGYFLTVSALLKIIIH